MREATIITTFNQLFRMVKDVEDGVKTALAGEMMMQQAIKDVLIDKKICTEKELAGALAKVVEKANQAPVDKSKELVKPTTQQAAEVEASKTDKSEVDAKKE